MPEKATDTKPVIVDYSTFVRDLNDSKVQQVDIYDFGRSIELTYTDENGTLYATRSPIGLKNDTLLSSTLASRQIPYITHAESYPHQFTFGTDWWIHLSTYIFMLVPILMLVAIVRQADTIRKLGETIAELAEKTVSPKTPTTGADLAPYE